MGLTGGHLFWFFFLELLLSDGANGGSAAIYVTTKECSAESRFGGLRQNRDGETAGEK